MLYIKQTIAPAKWMVKQETLKVMETLNGKEGEINALFVGGCVRDTILGKEVFDIDVACKFSPEHSTKLLKEAGIKVIPTGIDHGTITAVCNHKPFEITTLRRDVKTFGRKAEVEFTEDWIDDARRRDFTINTILLDVQGRIYDPLGLGVEDLKQGRIRFVGDPEKRIQEDYLRILRFFRFYALLGEVDLEKSELELCQKYSEKILLLSKERITTEYLKIIASDKAGLVLALMQEYHVLSDLIKCNDFDALNSLVKLQDQYKQHNVLSRLYLVSFPTGPVEPADQIFLQLSGKENKTLNDLSRAFKELASKNLSLKSIKEISYRFSLDIAWQASLLLLSMSEEKILPKDIEHYFNEETVPVFPVRGKDLIKIGIEAGPQMGDLLEQTESWWVDKEFQPNKRECIDYLKTKTIKD